jgi:putative membrane protein
MARYEERVLDSLEKMVEDFESGTSAELVVVLAHRSERYRDVPFKVGCIAAFTVLALLIYLPVDFSANLLLLDTFLAFSLGYVAGRTSPFLVRHMTTRKRRDRSVRRCAQAAFTSQGVSMTRERNGVLVFISWLERKVELIPDVGVDRCVALPVWNQATRELLTRPLKKGFPDSFIQAFQPLSRAFAEHMPCTDDNPDEIPNRPVVIG